jgi:DNA-binding NtrC family response regulator
MKPLSIVIAYSNPKHAEVLCRALDSHCRVMNLATSFQEMVTAISRHRANVAIVDLELPGLTDVQQLVRQFPATSMICTHRLADDRMWAKALSAGAVDFCNSSDVRAITSAACGASDFSHAQAA